MGKTVNAVRINRYREWPDGCYDADLEIDAPLYTEIKQVAELQRCEVEQVIEKALRYYLEELGDLDIFHDNGEDE